MSACWVFFPLSKEIWTSITMDKVIHHCSQHHTINILNYSPPTVITSTYAPPTSITFSCLGYNKIPPITSVQPSFIYPYLPLFLCQFWPIPPRPNRHKIIELLNIRNPLPWPFPSHSSRQHATNHAGSSTMTTQPCLPASGTIYTPLPPTLIKLCLSSPSYVFCWDLQKVKLSKKANLQFQDHLLHSQVPTIRVTKLKYQSMHIHSNTGELRTGSSKWCDHTLTGVITLLGLHPVERAPLRNVWNAILWIYRMQHLN